MNKSKKINILFWALSALCMLYGLKVFLAGSGTLFFAVWFVIGLVFLGLAYGAKHEMWSKIPMKYRHLIMILLILFFIVFVTMECIILSHYWDKGEPNLDYIIVLGAQVYEDGPSPVLKFRLDKALEYLNDNPDTKCIVSGGQGYNEPFPEAICMADYLIRNGIAEERIKLEIESENTEQNITNSMVFIPEDASVGIVTNNFHVYRAVKIAERCGLDHVCGISSGSKIGFIPNNMLREFLGMVKFILT